jgi:hypothetical protein
MPTKPNRHDPAADYAYDNESVDSDNPSAGAVQRAHDHIFGTTDANLTRTRDVQEKAYHRRMRMRAEGSAPEKENVGTKIRDRNKVLDELISQQ